jgi:2-dehydro-3-deoxyphosphogluconate aldolase/(4S)-4-hydroxy-2-oxoglutarate aldolase
MNIRGTSMFTIAPQKLMPVIIINEISQAEPLREALKLGGINSAEVTLRTPNALQIIRIMSEDPDFYVGAGTVLTAAEADLAHSAGAQFMVSPGLSLKVVDECDRSGVPYFPGVATPTEIQRARDLGFTELKFFPAEALGGEKYLKALVAPFHDTKFIPTGGINLSNINSYLSIPQVVAVGGSWIVNEKLLATEDYAAITSLTREAISHIKSSAR